MGRLADFAFFVMRFHLIGITAVAQLFGIYISALGLLEARVFIAGESGQAAEEVFSLGPHDDECFANLINRPSGEICPLKLKRGITTGFNRLINRVRRRLQRF